MLSANIVRTANRLIWDFVHHRSNVALRAGTGCYSTPFRGGLFGQEQSTEVARRLATRRVDVLWLGTNPCVPASLRYIVERPRGLGDLPSFRRQMESGFFGSRLWDADGTESADFNPIETPERNWRVYQRLVTKIARPRWVAMANVIPWGSRSIDQLVDRLRAANLPLLKRILEFADDLNVRIVEALSPRLMVVPFSLARSRVLDQVRSMTLSLHGASNLRCHVIGVDEGNFRFYTGHCRRGKLTVRTVFLRHPSSLRISGASRRRVVAGVARVLERF